MSAEHSELPASRLAPLLSPGETWPARREALLRAWREYLGPLPTTRAALAAEFAASEHASGFIRQEVRYQIEEGVFAEAYLLTPTEPAERRPAVVVFHQTTRTHIRQAAGVDSTIPELMQGLHFVERGYVVLCPRCFIFDDGAVEAVGFAKNVELMQRRHPDWTGQTRMLWDAMRAVDFLESLPAVDRARIGCIGHSLGAREALYAAAFDPRYRAAVFNEGGIDHRRGNWNRPWYLGPRAQQPDFSLAHHQLLGLMAPRAFLLLAGDAEDNDDSRAFLDAARPIYRLLGAEENLGWFNHRGGHRYPPSARALAEAFLDAHLQG